MGSDQSDQMIDTLNRTGHGENESIDEYNEDVEVRNDFLSSTLLTPQFKNVKINSHHENPNALKDLNLSNLFKAKKAILQNDSKDSSTKKSENKSIHSCESCSFKASSVDLLNHHTKEIHNIEVKDKVIYVKKSYFLTSIYLARA